MEKLTNTINNKNNDAYEHCEEKIGIPESKVNKIINFYSNANDKWGLINGEPFETESNRMKQIEGSHEKGESDSS